MHMLNKYWIGWILIQLNQHLLSMYFRVSQPHHWYHFGPDDSLLWGHSVHCRMFRSFLGLYPLYANSTRQLWQPKMSFSSVQFSRSVVSDSCDPVNRSTPGLPVHHQLPEFTQTHIHWVSDAIQPSHPLSSASPPAPKPSQHQSLFQWKMSLDIAKCTLKVGQKSLFENHWFTVFLTQSLSFFLMFLFPGNYFDWLWCFYLFGVLLWPHHMACGILVPWPGVEPGPWQWHRWALTTGLPLLRL